MMAGGEDYLTNTNTSSNDKQKRRRHFRICSKHCYKYCIKLGLCVSVQEKQKILDGFLEAALALAFSPIPTATFMEIAWLSLLFVALATI